MTDIFSYLIRIMKIPPKSTMKIQYAYDKESYKTRHKVENFFADLKQCRGTATR